MKIAPAGRRSTFTKVIVIALIVLGIFLYIPFTSKAFLPTVVVSSVTSTLSSPTFRIKLSRPDGTQSTKSSVAATAVSAKQPLYFSFNSIEDNFKLLICSPSLLISI
jgi:hypothetical protein